MFTLSINFRVEGNITRENENTKKIILNIWGYIRLSTCYSGKTQKHVIDDIIFNENYC